MEQLIQQQKTMFKNYPDVMNVEQMCRALHISRNTAYCILKDGKLHSLKIGREYKIPKCSLIEYLNVK